MTKFETFTKSLWKAQEELNLAVVELVKENEQLKSEVERLKKQCSELTTKMEVKQYLESSKKKELEDVLKTLKTEVKLM